MFYTAPLEQFEIYNIFNINLFPIPILISNWNVYIIFLIVLLIILSIFFIYNLTLLSYVGHLMLELLYLFMAGLTSRHCNIEGLKFFPLFFLTFLFVLFANIIGLIPLSFTLTSQLILPVILAVSYNLSFFFWGLAFHGFNFFQVFVPRGVPILLLPLVVVIEIISYLLRSFSLSVRLFANMMAGHTLLYILSSFVVALAQISLFLGLVPALLVLGVSFLEIGIAALQAYVFVVLLSIYVTDALHPGH